MGGDEQLQPTNNPQVSEEGVVSEGGRAGSSRGQGSLQTEEGSTTAFTGREDQPLEEQDAMDRQHGDYGYGEQGDTGGQNGGQSQRQDTEQVRDQREKDQIAGGQVYNQKEKNRDTGEQNQRHTGGYDVQWENQRTGGPVRDQKQDWQTGEQGRSQDIREHEKQYPDAQHRQDRGPEVLHQRVEEDSSQQDTEQDNSHQDTGEQDSGKGRQQDTEEQDSSHQDTGGQDGSHQDMGEEDSRQDDPDPFPDEEDEPYYGGWLSCVKRLVAWSKPASLHFWQNCTVMSSGLRKPFVK